MDPRPRLFRNSHGFVVKTEIPVLDPKDIDISLFDDLLMIKRGKIQERERISKVTCPMCKVEAEISGQTARLS